MDIRLIPKSWLKSLNEELTIYHCNILISHAAIIVMTVIFSDILMTIVNSIPHFCLFRLLFGFDCIGCGVTRGLISLSQLKIEDSIRDNPASLVIAIAVLVKIPLGVIALMYSSLEKTLFDLSIKINKIVFLSILIVYSLKLLNLT